MARPTAAKIYRQWVINFTCGELVGFGGIPVLGGALAFQLTASVSPDIRSLVFYAIAVIGGLGEGAVLAWFQMRVLRQVIPKLSGRRWMSATALAASIAWMLGYLAPTLDDIFALSPLVQIAIWVPAGVFILLSIDTAQAWVLRGLIERPRRWIGVNALGWLLGLPWTFILPALVPDNAPVLVWILAFIVAGALMGLTAGAVTGRLLIHLQPSAAR